jgi:Zn-dependent peptidase ImmA (M78 family)
MAHENRSAAELAREQRLADTLVRRYGLEPPIDVHALAAEFADLEHDSIPGQCDGLVVGLDSRTRSRPLIVLTRTTNLVRERFTVAHELGHVLLPWHGTTTLACDIDADLSPQAYLATQAEVEANRFAADLLVPPAWLSSLIASEGTEHIGRLVLAIQPAQVSAHVACLALSRQLPAGHVFAILENHDLVALAGTSPDTSVDPPKRGHPLTRRLDRFADTKESIQFGSRRLVWWTFTQTGTESDDDSRTSKDVLAALLDRHVTDPKKAHAIRASFGGIVGSANNSVGLGRRFTEEELYGRLRLAFTKTRDLPSALLDDPEFAIWMRKRAREVALT